MQRTNIYLSNDQLAALRGIGASRGIPVASLVREAIDFWLDSQGISLITEDEWERRFAELLSRRERRADSLDVPFDEIEEDVASAVSEVRRARAARRR